MSSNKHPMHVRKIVFDTETHTHILHYLESASTMVASEANLMEHSIISSQLIYKINGLLASHAFLCGSCKASHPFFCYIICLSKRSKTDRTTMGNGLERVASRLLYLFWVMPLLSLFVCLFVCVVGLCFSLKL